MRLGISLPANEDSFGLEQCLRSALALGAVHVLVDRMPVPGSTLEWKEIVALAHSLGAHTAVGRWSGDLDHENAAREGLRLRGYSHRIHLPLDCLITDGLRAAIWNWASLNPTGEIFAIRKFFSQNEEQRLVDVVSECYGLGSSSEIDATAGLLSRERAAISIREREGILADFSFCGTEERIRRKLRRLGWDPGQGEQWRKTVQEALKAKAHTSGSTTALGPGEAASDLLKGLEWAVGRIEASGLESERPADFVRGSICSTPSWNSKAEETGRLTPERVVPLPIEDSVADRPTELASAVCCTYGRPHLLEEAIAAFLTQTYESKEMVIVNDLPGSELVLLEPHPQIRIINVPERFPSLGAKRNFAKSQARGEYVFIWDDDDISLPWRMEESIRLLKRWPKADGVRSVSSMFSLNNAEYERYTSGIYGQACYRFAYCSRAHYDEDVSCGEDWRFEEGSQMLVLPRTPSCWLICRWGLGIYHISGRGEDDQALNWNLAGKHAETARKGLILLEPRWHRNYLEDLDQFLKGEGDKHELRRWHAHLSRMWKVPRAADSIRKCSPATQLAEQG